MALDNDKASNGPDGSNGSDDCGLLMHGCLLLLSCSSQVQQESLHTPDSNQIFKFNSAAGVLRMTGKLGHYIYIYIYII